MLLIRLYIYTHVSPTLNRGSQKFSYEIIHYLRSNGVQTDNISSCTINYIICSYISLFGCMTK